MKFLTFLLLALFGFNLSGLYAQEKPTTQTSAVAPLSSEKVSELLFFIMKDKRNKKASSTGIGYYYEASLTIGSEQISFQYLPEKNLADSTVALWWRQTAVSIQESMQGTSFSLDGKVLSGMGYSKLDKHFIADAKHASGLEFAEHWQKETNKRILAALEYYKKSK